MSEKSNRGHGPELTWESFGYCDIFMLNFRIENRVSPAFTIPETR